MYSLNYGDVDRHDQHGDREGILKLLLEASEALVTSSADCLLECAKTFHQFADKQEQTDVPLVVHAMAAVDLALARR